MSILVQSQTSKDNGYLYIGPDNSSQTISVESGLSHPKVGIHSSSDWTAMSNDSWLILTVDHGTDNENLEFYVDKNPVHTPRNGTITLTNTEVGNVTMTVTQDAEILYFFVDSQLLNASNNYSFKLRYDCGWSIQNKSSWIHFSFMQGIGSGSINMYAQLDYNNETTPRDGHFQIVASDPNVKPIEMLVHQNGASPYLRLGQRECFFNSSDTDPYMVLVSSNTNWYVSDDSYPTWIHLNKTKASKNDTLLVWLDPNPSASTRESEVHISNGTETKTIIITQNGIDAPEIPILTIGSNQVYFDANGSKAQKFKFKSNKNWAVVGTGNLDGVHFNRTEGTKADSLMIWVDPNHTINSKSWRAYLTNGSSNVYFTINQAGEEEIMEVSTESVTVSSKNTSFEIEVKSNTRWRLYTPNRDYWMTTESGDKYLNSSGNQKVKFHVAESFEKAARSLTIIVKGENVQKTISVVQEPLTPYLNIETKEIKIPNTGVGIRGESGEYPTINVTGNVSFIFESDVSWMQADYSSYTTGGGYKGNVKINAYPNTSAVQRIGYIHVQTAELADEMITVTQEATVPDYSLSTHELNVDSYNYVETVYVNSNINWNVRVEDTPWIQVTQKKDKKPCININYDRNESVQSRTGYVIITRDGMEDDTVVVNQKGSKPYLFASRTSIRKSYEIREVIEINSNTLWAAECSASWLDVKVERNSITLYAPLYKSVNDRSATIVLSAPGLENTTITVDQVAVLPEFYLDKSSILLENSHTTQTVQIVSELAWTTKVDGTWFTVDKSSGSENATLSISCTKYYQSDNRSGSVTFSAKGLPDIKLSILQFGLVPYLYFDSDSYFIGHNGIANQEIIVRNNVPFTVSSNQPWLNITSSIGEESSTISIHATENQCSNSREATVTISSSLLNEQTIKFIQEGAASVVELKNDNAAVYPNPVIDKLYINPELISSEMRLYDVSNHLIMTKTIDGSPVDLSQLPSAMYILIIKDRTGILSYKLIKQ